MAVSKLLNLLALSCVAILASYGPAPAAALSVGSSHEVRHAHHANVAAVVNKRASTSKRCKPRPSSSITASVSKPTTQAPTHAPTKATPAPEAPKPDTTKSSSTSKPTSGNSGSNSGSFGGPAKAGLAWPNGEDKSIKNFRSAKVDTYYTWSPWCVKEADALGMQCCPMLWGDKQIGDFTKLVKPGYAKCVMGPNEPNQAGQSDMAPAHAASLWRQYIDPLHDSGYTTISPACTNAPSGKTWMTDFFNACKGCKVDKVALHFYGTSADDMIKYIEDIHNTFGLPIVVSEFACQNFGGGAQANEGQVFEFMKKVTQWMDQTDYVHKYFAFGAMHDMVNVSPLNQLMGSNGFPTALGKLYIGA